MSISAQKSFTHVWFKCRFGHQGEAINIRRNKENNVYSYRFCCSRCGAKYRCRLTYSYPVLTVPSVLPQFRDESEAVCIRGLCDIEADTFVKYEDRYEY